jgi:hypothetical protein
MARKQTLFFVKLNTTPSTDYSEVKFLLTAKNETLASEAGLALIAEQYQKDYRVTHCIAVCQTTDTVTDFEPV